MSAICTSVLNVNPYSVVDYIKNADHLKRAPGHTISGIGYSAYTYRAERSKGVCKCFRCRQIALYSTMALAILLYRLDVL